MIGAWQILLVLYILFLALGPRRVVRWWRIWNRFLARMQGLPPPTERSEPAWLRAVALFEHSSKIGWACVAVGIGLIVVDGVCRQTGCAFTGPVMLVLAMILFFLAPWMI